MATVKFKNRSISRDGETIKVSYTLKIKVGNSEAVSKIVEYKANTSVEGWEDSLKEKIRQTTKDIKSKVTEKTKFKELEGGLDLLESELSE